MIATGAESKMSTATLKRPLVLALDLDDTFSKTGDEQRAVLLQLLAEHHEDIRLLYMSHDSAERLIQLAAESGLPMPEVLLADSGTTVLKGDGTGTVEPLQRNILQLWPGKEAVTRNVEAVDGVTVVVDDAPCRQGFKYTSEEGLEGVKAKAEDMGCHTQLRGDGRVDLLPYGVDKGSTLGRWLVQLNVAPARVLAFGEDHGDISLFGRGWRGVVFPHAPEAIVDEARGFHDVFVAREDGAGGVLSALQHFGWIQLG